MSRLVCCLVDQMWPTRLARAAVGHDTWAIISADLPTSLSVEHCGEHRTLSEIEELTFGRDADLVIGEDDQFVHRLTGRFLRRNGLWWLQNLGTHLRLQVLDSASGSHLELAPGVERPLALTDGVVRFVAGRTTYELEISVTADLQVDRDQVLLSDLPGGATLRGPALPLNEEQRLLVVSLAEPRLRDPHDRHMPSNKAVCRRLGWSKKKFDGKLDYLCRRLDELGVPGLRGDVAALAKDRRAVLVEHALSHGTISRADLALLPEP